MSETDSVEFSAEYSSTSESTKTEQFLDELLLNHSSSAEKQAERESLNAQIEAFLSSGGKISQIDPNVMADPPKKPENRYGSHPI